jgi:hypothetical protein
VLDDRERQVELVGQRREQPAEGVEPAPGGADDDQLVIDRGVTERSDGLALPVKSA